MDFATIFFFILVFIMVIICYIAYAIGMFNKFRRTHYLFAGIAGTFPLIDVVQTWSALQIGAEGNPLLMYILTSLPQGLGWLFFIMIHLVFCALGLYLGWKGKNEQAADERTLAAFFGLLWATLVIWNTTLIVMYRVF